MVGQAWKELELSFAVRYQLFSAWHCEIGIPRGRSIAKENLYRKYDDHVCGLVAVKTTIVPSVVPPDAEDVSVVEIGAGS